MGDASSSRFWTALDRLAAEHRLVFDRPRGSRHPRYPDAVYPVNYGFLEETGSADGAGIDVWRGSLSDGRVTGALMTVDMVKRDVEIKLLIGCTEEEARLTLDWHNSGGQSALLIERPSV